MIILTYTSPCGNYMIQCEPQFAPKGWVVTAGGDQ